MKFRYPDKKVFNFLSLMYLPVMAFMITVTVDLWLAYQAGEVAESWKPMVALALTTYLGFRSWRGVHQAVDFSKD